MHNVWKRDSPQQHTGWHVIGINLSQQVGEDVVWLAGMHWAADRQAIGAYRCGTERKVLENVGNASLMRLLNDAADLDGKLDGGSVLWLCRAIDVVPAAQCASWFQHWSIQEVGRLMELTSSPATDASSTWIWLKRMDMLSLTDRWRMSASVAFERRSPKGVVSAETAAMCLAEFQTSATAMELSMTQETIIQAMHGQCCSNCQERRTTCHWAFARAALHQDRVGAAHSAYCLIDHGHQASADETLPRQIQDERASCRSCRRKQRGNCHSLISAYIDRPVVQLHHIYMMSCGYDCTAHAVH